MILVEQMMEKETIAKVKMSKFCMVAPGLFILWPQTESEANAVRM
jgi:hypothetical protein